MSFTLNGLFSKWKLNNIKLNIGFGEIEFVSSEEDKQAAWELYVELLTRITTQPLPENSGDEQTALDSVFSLFRTTREILKSRGREAQLFTKIAVVVLNQVIRPFTAKWHKLSLEKCFENQNQCDLFRQELKLLQNDLSHYSGLLSELAEVEDLTYINEL